jgi:hypothetical protein
MRNIGDKRGGPVIEIELRLTGKIAANLITEALARNVKPIDLLADIIEHCCRDKLFDAVIDA